MDSKPYGMSVFETSQELKSFRKCRDETIPRKVIGKALEAGRQAPSPGNVQSVEFVVVEDEDKREMLSDSVNDPRVEEAPTAVIIIGDIERMERRVGDHAYSFSNAEAAMTVQNMRLTAQEEGVYSSWISGFDEDLVADQFGVPTGKSPLGVLIFGYTDNPVESPPRFGMNEICFYDEYGNQVDRVFDGFEWGGIQEEKEVYRKKAGTIADKIRRALREFL